MQKKQFNFSENLFTVNFEKDGSKYSLTYQLYDHCTAKRWAQLIKESIQKKSMIWDNGIFFGSGVVNKEKISAALEHNVSYHNQYCERVNLPDCKIPVGLDNPVTQQRLNLLHDYFEKYAEDVRVSSDNEASFNMQNMNLNIHRLESCLSANDSGHVEILNSPRMALPLEDEDYENFTPHYKWGELYLTYGMTGVPTINAFHMKSQPTPQNVVTNGCMLAFWGDVEFKRFDDLQTYLKSKNMDINDPRAAIGYIPLGVLLNVETLDRKAILNNIKKHDFIKNIDINKLDKSAAVAQTAPAKKFATWPFHSEVMYHLDLVPYIDLGVTFDAKKMYQEAEKALAYFVSHRDYDQESKQSSGKWKSLALRGLFGDYTKTQYHTSYQFEGKPEYRNTVFAELCPETMKFLETITDVNKCERVRFMLLEPGASIKTHRDSQDRDVSFAVNISLNMPEECIFYSNLNKDGTENDFTVKLPFKDSGSVLLFNNAKYHKVVNNSNTPRIHIIFHGPIKFTDSELIQLARKQNKIYDYQDLIRQLINKKNIIGEELTKTPSLFNDWVITGLRGNSLPENFSLAVYDHEKYFEGPEASRKYLKLRTIPRLFPLNFDVIKEKEWDEYLHKSFESGKEFAIIMASGSFVLMTHPLIKGIVANAHELKSKNWPAAGHLMDFNNGKQLPYFHEQFIIVYLKAWNELGRPALGPLYTPVESTLIDAEISSENIHDNYTPLFIQAAAKKNGTVLRAGCLNWGSLLIQKAVESGRGVMNLNNDIRCQKLYAYPRDEIQKPKEEIEKEVNQLLTNSLQEIYYFNNEPLSMLEIPDFSPDKIISVAAGFKSFQMLNQYCKDNNPDVHYMDFSANALSYIKDVVKLHSFEELRKKLKDLIEKDSMKSYSLDKVDDQLDGIVRTYFENSKEQLMKAISKASKATFDVVNLIQNPEAATQFLSPKDRFAIWVSNAFYNNSLYLVMTKEEADERLLVFVRQIAQKTGTKAFRLQNLHTFVFGESLKNIRGIVTDGAVAKTPFTEDRWIEIN